MEQGILRNVGIGLCGVRLDCDSYTDTTQTYTNIPKNALLHYRKQTSKGSQPVGMIYEGEYVSARKW